MASGVSSPLIDHFTIHAWDAQAIVPSARSAGVRTVRRNSCRNSGTVSSVEIAPSTRANVSPSIPSAMASASSATHSGFAVP